MTGRFCWTVLSQVLGPVLSGPGSCLGQGKGGVRKGEGVIRGLYEGVW